jgi:hypothetical protein
MSKYFRPWNIDQTLLLPPNVQDFVPKGHVSRFIVELVRESLDLKEITGSYVSGLGQPPFDPRGEFFVSMIYGTCQKCFGSKIDFIPLFKKIDLESVSRNVSLSGCDIFLRGRNGGLPTIEKSGPLEPQHQQ